MKKIFCEMCKNEIPIGFVAIGYDNKFFDNYSCLAVFNGVRLDSNSFLSLMDKSTLKTIVNE
jgi:hypothetical protein